MQALTKNSVPIASVKFDKNAFDGVVKDSRGGIYDVACVDENGTHFIVEMQLSSAPYFFQRLKFYAFHKFNSMVLRGDYDYNNLTKIYCIGILANNIFGHSDFHTVGTIKNEAGLLLDDQITYITVELDKFLKTSADVSSDLDKLIYTMKTIHTVTDPTQYPQFWTEEWLRKAIEELDKRQMTPDERFAYERALAINAESIRVSKQAITDAVQEAIEEATQKANQQATEKDKRAVERMLKQGKLSVEEIADSLEIDKSLVIQTKKDLGL
ncbi:Rpn family recombination-promoting nuclease/putative transposase [Spirosoma koreense]